jgi:inorganic pyrophosphatase
VLGALEMIEDGETEYNIFAVPCDDPRFMDVRSLDDLVEQNIREIEQFFTAFKRMEGDEDARVEGWLDRERACVVIRDSIRS